MLSFISKKLMTLREPGAKPVDEWQYAFYQKWYHSVIHALLSIYEFKGGYKKLASMLKPAITAKQAHESIELLMKIGLLEQGEDGIYRPKNNFVTSGDRWQSIAIHNFQKETINLSALALDLHPKELRDISTLTVTLSAKDLPEIRERIGYLRQTILSLQNDYEPDTVFQINIQVIPVTQTVGGNQ
ncbi:MAG TPA: TIGR02147 family protein [Chitinispirillaceae bacterium]|nr:TIGR02147 family protein [Chitinispirillaceae bacterium]